VTSEELVSVIRARVIDTLGDDVAAACLFRLADRGVFSIRELPEVAYQLSKRYGDTISAVTDVTVNQFANAAGIPATTGGRT
jgi:hypothetical protein